MSQARVRGREMQRGFWWENVKVRAHLENPGADGEKCQKCDLQQVPNFSRAVFITDVQFVCALQHGRILEQHALQHSAGYIYVLASHLTPTAHR